MFVPCWAQTQTCCFPGKKKPPQTERNPSAHNFSATHFSNYFFQSLSLTIASTGYPVLPVCLLTLQTMGNCIPYYHGYEYADFWESLMICFSCYNLPEIYSFRSTWGSGRLADSSIVVVFYLCRSSTQKALENSNCLSPEQSQSLTGCHRQKP